MAACVSASASACAKGKKKGSSPWKKVENDHRKVKDRLSVKVACSSSSIMDPYKTLRIEHGASESEVKKAFRRLALQYHPDVCRDSRVEFHVINEAYDVVMRQLRGEEELQPQQQQQDEAGGGDVEEDWEPWEEWMGWEGAGIRDYSSHINPYI